MRKFYSLLLKLLGWHYVLNTDIPPKCVLCVAPHTSNWDFLIGLSFYKSIGGKPHILMKKELFFFPFNYLLKALGGIPVNRKKKTSLSEQMVELFDSEDDFQLAIAPEGTRKKNAEWKSGFYYIALAAQVPIVLAYLDYGKKEVGVFTNFYPTGDAEADIAKIKAYYKDVEAKYPKLFSIR
ncbi:lysophospholipid acyltransferase family protein [Bacteroidales bacterium OttesenSCG-928-J19]|nr:lysophospholipid acyltransferase family protein [Bacteroidales bacterium OttesenSCG-928-J19]